MSTTLDPPDAPPSWRRTAATAAILLLTVVPLVASIATWQHAGEHALPQPLPAAHAPEPRFAATIRPRPRAAAIPAGVSGPDGKPLMVSCATCHATRPPNSATRNAADLRELHTGLTMKHGDLTCVSCHNPGDGYMTFRLADGRPVPFDQPMALCAQCHGPQYRDYLNGAHGGMTGHWDLSRGPRVRNSCVECHDPHAPAIRPVRPAPGPRDRFLPAKGEGRHE